MINRCHFDPSHGYWIEECIPVAAPEKALAQSIRCYMPSDFLLLLESTGLFILHMEVYGQKLDTGANAFVSGGPLTETWCYIVQLTLDNIVATLPPEVGDKNE